MKLPFGLGKPMETPIKKLVDETTRIELEKLVPFAERTRHNTSKALLLGYLSEPRTIQELTARFSYKTLASAYASIRLFIKSGEIINLGHGLYVSASAKVDSFNIQDLPERELQERGYDKYKEELTKKAEPPVTLPDAPLTIDVPPARSYHRHVKDQEYIDYLAEPHSIREASAFFGSSNPSVGNRRFNNLLRTGKIKISHRAKAGESIMTMTNYYQAVPGAVAEPAALYGAKFKQRMTDEQLLDFLAEPRSVREIGEKWEFKTMTGVDKRLRRMARRGLVVRALNTDRDATGTGSTYLYQASTKYKPAMGEPADITLPVEPPVLPPSPAVLPPYSAAVPPLYSAADIEQKAMRYYWNRETYSKEDRQSVRDFIKWLQEQEKTNG